MCLLHGWTQPNVSCGRAGNDEESEEDEDLLLGEDNSKGLFTAAASSMAVRSVVAVAEAQIAELAARSQLRKDVSALNKLKVDVKVAEEKIKKDEKHLSETCEISNTLDEEKKAKVTKAPTRAPTRTTRTNRGKKGGMRGGTRGGRRGGRKGTF